MSSLPDDELFETGTKLGWFGTAASDPSTMGGQDDDNNNNSTTATTITSLYKAIQMQTMRYLRLDLKFLESYHCHTCDAPFELCDMVQYGVTAIRGVLDPTVTSSSLDGWMMSLGVKQGGQQLTAHAQESESWRTATTSTTTSTTTATAATEATTSTTTTSCWRRRSFDLALTNEADEAMTGHRMTAHTIEMLQVP